jgi:CheY-like chemotaxis protein
VSGLDPADRAELLAMFLEDAPNRLQRIVDGHDAEREAHTLAGGAATAGLARVEALARALETALADGDENDVARTLDLLRAELDAAVAQRPGTVLCIEDDPTSRLLVERIVARRPRMILATAATGEEGLALAFENPPDIVLLDLRLPDLPGDEVLRRLKGRPETAGSRVIVLSAEAHALRRDELLAAGADAYLTKPIDVGELLAVLDGAVDR